MKRVFLLLLVLMIGLTASASAITKKQIAILATTDIESIVDESVFRLTYSYHEEAECLVLKLTFKALDVVGWNATPSEQTNELVNLFRQMSDTIYQLMKDYSEGLEPPALLIRFATSDNGTIIIEMNGEDVTWINNKNK